MRFSFAVHYLQAGSELRSLPKILGHKAPQVTEELYWKYQTAGVRSNYEVQYKRRPIKTWSTELNPSVPFKLNLWPCKDHEMLNSRRANFEESREFYKKFGRELATYE